jgi:hypothetical protein
VGYEKETIHKVYDDKEAENFEQNKMPLSTWFTYRFRQKVLDDRTMELEGSIDEQSFGSYTDNVKMTELNDKAKGKLRRVLKNKDKGAFHGKMTKLRQVWTMGAYSGLYIQLTGTKKGAIRNLTVKQI